MTYTITIEKTALTGCGAYNTSSQTLEVKSFDSKKEANKEIRRMVKEEGYKRGYFVNNPNLNTELHLNY